MTPEPIFDLAHLGHMELLTPKPDESLKFFVDVMGMTISGRKGESVYLRGWDDYERYSLKLTASKTSGMEHMALRARSQQALERRVTALKGSEFEIGWTDGDIGHGPAFRCRDPDGHIIELYYETEWYQAPPDLKPALKNQAQRFPARGVNVRRLDHLNCLAVDIKANRIFFETYLGCRLTEQIVLDDGTEAAMWMTMSNKSYDFPIHAITSRHRAASITSPTPSTAAKTSCAPPIYSWRTASTSKPARTSTPSSRPSSSTSTNPAAIASKSPTPAPASSWRRTGSRSCGPRKSVGKGRRGG